MGAEAAQGPARDITDGVGWGSALISPRGAIIQAEPGRYPLPVREFVVIDKDRLLLIAIYVLDETVIILDTRRTKVQKEI